jgi:hypothetical protein
MGYPRNQSPSSFAELLIDCEEDRTLRAVLVGMLREMEAWSGHLWSPRDVVAWLGLPAREALALLMNSTRSAWPVFISAWRSETGPRIGDEPLSPGR